MPRIQIQELGVTLDFPDGTPQDVIDSAIQEQIDSASKVEHGAVAHAALYAGGLASDVGKSALQGLVGDNLRFMIGAQERRNIEEEVTNPGAQRGRIMSPRTQAKMREWATAQQEMGRPIDKEVWNQQLIATLEKERDEDVNKMRNIVSRLPKPSDREHWYERAIIGSTRFLGSMGVTAVDPLAGFAMMFTQMAGDAYDQYVNEGVDKKRAWEAAVINATLQSPLEMAGTLLEIGFLKHLGRAFIKGGIKTKRIVDFIEMITKTAAGEGGEEFLQTYAEEIANVYAAHPEKSNKEIVKDVWDRRAEIASTKGVEAFRGGAFAGASLFGLAGAIQAPFTLSAYVDENQFAKKSKEFEKNADKFAEGVKTAVSTGVMDQEDIDAIKENLPDNVKDVIAEKLGEAEKLLKEQEQVTAEPIPAEVTPTETKPEEVTPTEVTPEEEKPKVTLAREEYEKYAAEKIGKIVDEIEVTIEETGDKLTLRRDARKALKETNDKIDVYNQLLECMAT